MWPVCLHAVEAAAWQREVRLGTTGVADPVPSTPSNLSEGN